MRARSALLCLTLGGLLAAPCSVTAQMPIRSGDHTVAPNYQVLCTNGVHKLSTGIEVIGASPRRIESARAAATRATQQMERGDYYGCYESVRGGLSALDAG